MEVTRPFTFSYFPEIHIKKKKKGGDKETGKKIQRKISKVKTPSNLSWASEMHLRNNLFRFAKPAVINTEVLIVWAKLCSTESATPLQLKIEFQQ